MINVKINNRTEISTTEIEAVIKAAKRYVNFKSPHDIEIEVEIKERLKNGDAGLAIAGRKIQISLMYMVSDSLGYAESFFQTACHEWLHIKDYWAGKSFERGKGMSWEIRPAERSVFDQLDRYAKCDHRKEMKKWRMPDYATNAVIDLGIAMEEKHDEIRMIQSSCGDCGTKIRAGWKHGKKYLCDDCHVKRQEAIIGKAKTRPCPKAFYEEIEHWLDIETEDEDTGEMRDRTFDEAVEMATDYVDPFTIQMRRWLIANGYNLKGEKIKCSIIH